MQCNASFLPSFRSCVFLLLASFMMKLQTQFPCNAGRLGGARRRCCDHSRQRAAPRLHWSSTSLSRRCAEDSQLRQPDHFKLRTRNSISSRTKFTMAPLYSSGDPVLRTSSPYPDPRVPGPASKILALNNNNYHSSSLSTLKLNMVTVNTVNKTALHPGGVLYVVPVTKPFLTVPSIVTNTLQACQGAHRT
jgi:hypothetical protein